MMVMEVVRHQAAKVNSARIETREKVGERPEGTIALERGVGGLKDACLQIRRHVRKGKARNN